jgi:hypothetical protein
MLKSKSKSKSNYFNLQIKPLLPKPNSEPTPLGFRPITLLNVEYKLYTHILNKTLLNWLLTNKILPPSQNGALPNRGTDACLWTLINTIQDAQTKLSPLHVIYIDFNKAFDSVEHWTLKEIFRHLNLQKMGSVISTLLKHSQAKIKINQKISDKTIFFNKGTKQGDIISPLLFILYLSPLLWKIHHDCKGYPIANIKISNAAIMDDIVFMTQEDSDVNKVMNSLTNFCHCTGISINPSKSKYACNKYANPKRPKYNNQLLENLGEDGYYKYLGIWINLKLDWTKQLNTSKSQVTLLMETISKKFYLNSTSLITLVNRAVIPSITYRMQVIQFPASWIEETQRIIAFYLGKATKLFLSYQMWQHLFGLTNLSQLNTITLINSIARNITPVQKNFAQPILTQVINNPQSHIFYILNNHNIKHINTTSDTSLPFWMLHKLPDIPYKASPSEHVRIFTDGSLSIIEGLPQMQAAIIQLKEAQFSFHCNGPVNSTEPELQAIEQTLLIYQQTRIIDIITDSMNAIFQIMKIHFNRHKTPNSPNKATLMNILQLIKDRQCTECHKFPEPTPNSGKWLRLTHVASHSDLNKIHKKANQNKFKSHTKNVIDGNKLADEMTGYYNKDASFPHPKNHPNREQTFLHHATHPSMEQGIQNQYHNQHIENWIKTDGLKAKRFILNNVDIEHTTKILKNTKFKLKSTIICFAKSLTLTLNTKPTVIRWLQQKNKPIPQEYSSINCSACIQQGSMERESNLHVVARCQNILPDADSLASSILNKINKLTHTNLHSFPWWFHNNLDNQIHTSAEAIQLERFDKDLGDRGFLPLALRSYLLKLTTTANTHHIISSINKLIAKHIFNRWIQRCMLTFPSPSNNM